MSNQAVTSQFSTLFSWEKKAAEVQKTFQAVADRWHIWVDATHVAAGWVCGKKEPASTHTHDLNTVWKYSACLCYLQRQSRLWQACDLHDGERGSAARAPRHINMHQSRPRWKGSKDRRLNMQPTDKMFWYLYLRNCGSLHWWLKIMNFTSGSEEA